MGEVYRAYDSELSREVAIKVLPAELTDSAERRERLVREARAAARLRHANVVVIHAVGESGRRAGGRGCARRRWRFRCGGGAALLTRPRASRPSGGSTAQGLQRTVDHVANGQATLASFSNDCSIGASK